MAKILLIDDDEQVRRLLREALESEGHMILESQNGSEGIAVFRAHPTDLVICDLIMPEKGGISTICELLASFPNLKVITMSGYTQQLGKPSWEFTKDLGVVSMMAKPFKVSEMLEAVNKAL